VQALLRRAQPAPSAATVTTGELTLDVSGREATFRGKKLTLTPREFDLLAFFVRHPGRVLVRDELLRKVWGYDYVGETRTVDVHVRRLRAKLADKGRLIQTVTGSGYKFVPSTNKT
jgi:DNA-binding response OmpR family regulator